MTIPPPLQQRRVFIDSSAYLALLDEGDEHHAAAVLHVHRLIGQRYRQYTTNVLLIESHALLLSTLGIAKANQFLKDMEGSHTAVIRVRAQDEDRAKQILFRYTDKDFSFADAISFVVMERLGIAQAFTFDRHFVQYGLTVLTP